MSLPGPPERVVVRGVNWLGDAVMTIPALKELRRLYPAARIDLVARPWVAELFRHARFVDRVVVYDKAGPHAGFLGLVRFARGTLAPERYDLAVVLQNAFEAALMMWLARVPVRAGYPTDGRWLFLNRWGRDETAGMHQTRRYLQLLSSTGLSGASYLDPAYRPDISLDLATDLAGRAAELLAARGLAPAGPVVGVNPGAFYGPAKRWFPDRYGAVARALVERRGATVLLFGSPGEERLAAEIAVAAGCPLTDFTGRTSLTDLLALLSRCDLVLTNDSGPMHLAAALGRPLIALFGSTDEVATGPASDRALVIHKHVECSPCLLRECPIDLRCFTRIEVAEVVAAAERMLDATPP